MTHDPCSHDVADHVDEAFDLLDQGNVDEAATLHAHLTASHPAQPEVVTLGGCIAAVRGEFATALQLFDRAASLDPTYPVPLIDAAELLVDDMDDPESALSYCERALPLTEGDDQTRIEALSFKARALMLLERDDEARAALEATRGLTSEDPDVFVRVTALWLELEDPDSAETCIRAALDLEPEHADALHALGWIHELRNEPDKMVEAWLATRALDASAPEPPWHMSVEAFTRVAKRALAELPAELRNKLTDVPMLVEDLPSEDLVRDGIDPRVLGLFSGEPMCDPAASGPAVEPTAIRLFQRNLESMSEGEEHLLSEIRTTVLHETAHYFGLEEDDLAKLGLD